MTASKWTVHREYGSKARLIAAIADGSAVLDLTDNDVDEVESVIKPMNTAARIAYCRSMEQPLPIDWTGEHLLEGRWLNPAHPCMQESVYSTVSALDLISEESILGKRVQLADGVEIIDLIGEDATLVLAEGETDRLEGRLKRLLKHRKQLVRHIEGMVGHPIRVVTPWSSDTMRPSFAPTTA